ncbi:MAG: hypothetical protein ACUVXA_18535 [Candidatus Jordarchaeum sp.]|uniref:hypothetical protein n=1 Tax=Candidatus Jordarchaeum sp. TaxID=2823881 RepID=UPI004049400F
MDKDIITVYLILKSKGEISWNDLLEESELESERLLRILLLLQIKKRVEKVGEKYVFLNGREKLPDEKYEILQCTDYHYERFKNGENMIEGYRNLSDVLELKIKKRLPFKAGFNSKTLDMVLDIDLDKGDGQFEIVYGKKTTLNIPHYIDSDSLLFDLFELFQFYKKRAEKEGLDFLISKAYGLFHKISNCEISKEECKLSFEDSVNQLEFEAALACIQICKLITETLGIESITMTIDTITRSRQCSTKEMKNLKKLEFLKKNKISTAYNIPLSPFEIGTLVMEKHGVPLCLLNNFNIFAKIPVRETRNRIEIDFTHVVEKYFEIAKKNNGAKDIDLDKISQLFFSMFGEEKNPTDPEELLNQLETREEIDLLNTLYLVSSLTMENQTKEVKAKIRYKAL